MDPQDLEPVRRKPAVKDLDAMSVAALRQYIAEMEAEIARAREAIAVKERARNGAESLFKR